MLRLSHSFDHIKGIEGTQQAQVSYDSDSPPPPPPPPPQPGIQPQPLSFYLTCLPTVPHISISVPPCLSVYLPTKTTISLPPSLHLHVPHLSTYSPTRYHTICSSQPTNQRPPSPSLSLHLTCLVGGTGSEWRIAAADIRCCLALCSIAPCTAAQSSHSSPVGTPHEPTRLAWLCE